MGTPWVPNVTSSEAPFSAIPGRSGFSRGGAEVCGEAQAVKGLSSPGASLYTVAYRWSQNKATASPTSDSPIALLRP